MKLRGQVSDGFACEEEVSTGSNTTDVAVVGNIPAMTSNVSSLTSVQKVLHSPDSTTTNQSADIEFVMRNKYTEPELMGDYGLRYVGNNGEILTRTGRLPTPGLPPVSESEASSASSSPAVVADVVEKSMSAVIHPKPKPKMKMQKPSRPLPCLKVRTRPRLQVRPRVRLRFRGRIATQADKAAMLAQAFHGIKATQAARGTKVTQAARSTKTTQAARSTKATQAARGAKVTQAAKSSKVTQASRGAAVMAHAARKEKQMDVDRHVQKKIMRKARQAREEQFIRDLLAFQEEMMKTDAELTRLIMEGREKIARVQERRRLREADRQKKRAKLAAFFTRE